MAVFVAIDLLLFITNPKIKYCPIKKTIDKTIKVVTLQKEEILNPRRDMLLSNKSVTSKPINI